MYLSKLINLGISVHNPRRNKLTRFLNIIGITSAFGGMLMFSVAYFILHDPVYMLFTALPTILYAAIPIFHFFGMVNWVRLYVSLFTPLWLAICAIFAGGFFGQGIGAGATIFMSAILFRSNQKLLKFLVVYNILLFIIPNVIINLRSPILGTIDYPMDEVVVFLMALGWVYVVFKTYEEDRENYTTTLLKNNDDLKSKTIKLQRFSNMASHDLKTPMRNITSFLNLIKSDVAQNKYDRIERFFPIISDSVDQMNELLNGIQEIASLDARDKSKYLSIDLNQALVNAKYNLQIEIQQKGAIIESVDLPIVNCHPSDFVIIFQNLLQNGIKYNQSKPPVINIKTEFRSEDFSIYIRDNGIGIDDQYKAQIFEFFKRLHNQQEYQGTGLGLAICKELVRDLDGQISVDSSIDNYSEFELKFPNQILVSKNVQPFEFSEQLEAVLKI